MRRPKPYIGPGVSVQVDWFGGLPVAPLEMFRTYAKEFEVSFLMFSVSLNEAISLRDSGSLTQSFQVVVVTSALCARLTEPLEDMLRSLAEHCREHGTIPSVAPLNPADFHGQRGQRSALKNSLWHRVLRSQQAQFLSKVRGLRGMVANIGGDFRRAADDLASGGATVASAPLWATMDAGHFDLNTCLRESIVLLKCFLRAMPVEQLLRFQRTVSSQKTVPRTAPTDTEVAAPVGSRASRIHLCHHRTPKKDTTFMLR